MDEPSLGEIRRRKRGGLFLRMAYLYRCLGGVFGHLLGELQSRAAVRAAPGTGQLYQDAGSRAFYPGDSQHHFSRVGHGDHRLIFWLPTGMVAQSDEYAHAGFLHQSDCGQCDCPWFG